MKLNHLHRGHVAILATDRYGTRLRGCLITILSLSGPGAIQVRLADGSGTVLTGLDPDDLDEW